MHVTFGSKNFKANEPLAIALGNFDGVHLGHQFLLKETIKIADKKNAIPTVYTFDPHPARIVAPYGAPPLIQTLDQRLDVIAECKIKQTIVEEFTQKLSKLNADEYFKQILLPLNPTSIVLGYDFTYGHNRSGTASHLCELGKANNIDVKVIEPQFVNGTLISSTIIRQLIAAGLIDEANELLGHPHVICGKIIKGEGKGTELGFPTANLIPENELIAGPGVYITETKIENGITLPSVTCTGPIATFGRHDFAVETYILDQHFEESLLDKNMSIYFLSRIRDMISFDSENELKIQIADDVKTAKDFFTSRC